jgi:hypothetical protein
MKVLLLPKTKLGIWPVFLILLMFLLLRVGFFTARNYYMNVPAGKTIVEDIFLRPVVALPMLTGFLSGITAFITGAISIIKRGERSLLVFVATTIGLLLIFFLLGEVFSPH